ncbi:MAG: zinc ribbon domain-containing protein [Acidobacteriota bacterium]
MLIRYCARCRSEFQMQVLECLDCGGPTDVRDDEVPFEYPEADLAPRRQAPTAEEDREEDRDEDDDEEEYDEGPKEPEPAIPPDAEVVIVRAAAYDWILDLAEALEQREIPVRIQKSATGEQYGLFVRVEDAEAAVAVDREVYLSGLREEIPEMREGACPACGTNLPPGAAECPECGLILSVVEETEDSETEPP